MPLPSALSPSHKARQKPPPPAHQSVGLFVVAALAAAIALVSTGCSTPAAPPAIDVPAQFAASTPSDVEPEAAWWETFHDPVLTDLVRRAERENRDVKIAAERLRAARSGVTVSRSFLMPSEIGRAHV